MAPRGAPIPNIKNAKGGVEGELLDSFEKWQQELNRKPEQQGEPGAPCAPGPVACPSLVDLPVGFAQVLKIVHVAAGGGVLCIQSLPLLGVRDLNEVPVVFHHKLAPGKLLSGDHAPALAIDEVNLLGGDEKEGGFTPAAFQGAWGLQHS